MGKERDSHSGNSWTHHQGHKEATCEEDDVEGVGDERVPPKGRVTRRSELTTTVFYSVLNTPLDP